MAHITPLNSSEFRLCFHYFLNFCSKIILDCNQVIEVTVEYVKESQGFALHVEGCMFF